MRTLLALILLAIAVPCASAQTITAASCSSTDVQTALNAVTVDGNIVAIPACSSGVTWSTTVTYSGSHSITILGAGSQVTTGGGDQTVIKDNLATSNLTAFAVSVPSGKTVRISGITLQNGTRSVVDNGSLKINCNDTIGELRIDHSHFANISTAIGLQDCFGVMDHNIFDEPSGNNNYLHVWNANYNKSTSAGNGDGSWASADDFGTAKFIYLENNVINTGTDDCTFGGRVVGRFNTMNTGGNWQTHPTGGGGADERGCRAYEVYQNSVSTGLPPTSPQFNFFFLSSGVALVWGNGATGAYSNFITLHSMRRDNSTYNESPTPGGWGYCGTSFNGTGSAWDQNTSGTTGYACIDQPGHGQGDLITGTMPSAINSTTGTIAWVHEALDPVYSWNNTWSSDGGCGGCGEISVMNPDVLTINQDYYSSVLSSSCSGASCTTGVGSGTLAARPANCTTGTAFWATDQGSWNSSGIGGQGVLYKCTATNTWTLSYTPFTFPHPLTALTPVATPTFSPVAGSYGSTQTVTIATSTGGATLCYTIDGSTPTANGAGTCTHGTTYSTTLTVAVTTTIKAIGSLVGDSDSAVATGVFTISGGLLPTVTLAPTSLAFASQTTGTTSLPQTITLTNTGTANLVLSSNATTTGGNTGDFAVSMASTCTNGTTVTPSNSCSIIVTFNPTAAGSRSSSVSISDNASGSPHTAPLTGTGIASSNQIVINCPATSNCKVVGQITMSTGLPILQPSISISPTTGSVQINGTFPLVATVVNDPSNLGAMWTVSGTNCTGAACGTISPTTSASGATVTYTAPPASPAGSVFITASAVANQASFQSNLTVITPIPPPTGPTVNNVFTPSASVSGTTKTFNFTGYSGPTIIANFSSATTSSAITGVQACKGSVSCVSLTSVNSIDLSGTKKTYQYRGINIGAGFDSVVVSTSDTNALNASIFDVINIGGFDTSATKTASATTNPTGPSVTTATDNELVFCALGTTGVASAVAVPFVFDLTGNQDGGASALKTPAGAISPSWTTTSATYAALCGAYSVGTVPPVVTVVNNPLSVAVQASATQAFTSIVGNDPANAGVDWTCAPISICGSFSSGHTASGTATTWTAPALVPPGATVALIQQPKGLVQTNPATFAISSSTAGSTLCVLDAWNTAAGTMTVTDSKGESWGAAIDTAAVAGHSGAYDCLPNNVGGVGSITVTVTGSSPTAHEWYVREYSGLLTSNIVDKFTHTTGSASPMDSGFMAATTNATNLLMGFGINGAASTFTVGNDGQGDTYGNLVKQTFLGSAVEDFFTTSATNTYKATLTPDTASGSAMFVAALKAGTGSGTGNAAITITATSTADATKAAMSTVTLTTATPPISVVVNPTSGTLTAGTGTISITPTVSNDAGAHGVTWTLSGLGSISLTSSASGTPTVYTPPASVSNASNAVITATSVTDPTKSATAAILVNVPSGGGGGTAVCSGGNCPAFAGAFGTAQGGGAASLGGSGRGGSGTPQVILVTNTNDSGTGSLRACLSATGPRFCIFRIPSGRIIQGSRMNITSPYVYVAGQTAPGGGIVQGGVGSAGQAFFISTHDVVIRYMTYDGAVSAVSGSTCNPTNGSVGLEIASANNFNIIIDHNTHYHWGNKDFEVISNGPTTNVHDITMQWNLAYEPCVQHYVITEPDVNQGGSQFASVNQDWHHNLFMNYDHRCPLLAIRQIRWVNVVCYNGIVDTSSSFQWSSWGAVQADIIGSKWVDGPQSARHVFTIVDQADPTDPADKADCNPSCDNGPAQGRWPGYYFLNNSGHPGTNTGSAPIPFTHAVNDAGNIGMFAAVTQAEGAFSPSTPPGASNPNGCGGPSATCWFRSTPLPAETYPITADPAESLDTIIAPTVGNSQHLDCQGNAVSNRNSEDSRVVNQYLNRGSGGAWEGPFYNGLQFPATPAIPAGTLCPMTFSTGLYDGWIQKYGLPTNLSNLATMTDPKSGYLYIEDFLDGIIPTHP